MKKQRFISLLLGFLTFLGLVVLSRCAIPFEYVSITTPEDDFITFHSSIPVSGYTSIAYDYFDDIDIDFSVNNTYIDTQSSTTFFFRANLEYGYNGITVEVYKNGLYQFSKTVAVYRAY
ncbi:MAG: hypothetical protein JW904_15095 [Spirochaetales bacterium]|nr:hypothetical protein [Spirochaetales bacterium]